jgi:glycosyltransferase involved in cell wall biosynthesis
MLRLNFFYRCPSPAYFSLEKLFKRISLELSHVHSHEFIIEDCFLPFPSKLKSIMPNILFTRRRQAAINHITGDIHYVILGCKKDRINILTIHDCVALHRYPPKHPRHMVLKWLWYEWPVRKADIVTVISENTKKELLSFVKCDPEKIVIIPDFVDPAFQPHPFHFKRERPQILFIGSTPNKNFERLIMAMEGLNAELEIVGHLHAEQLQSLTRHGIVYRQSTGLTQEALIEKYIQSDLLAFPSTYEGFGLPIVEAQAIGRPVLTSNLSPMKEVCGEGGCLVDPYEISSIRDGLLRIMENEAYREKIIQNGFANVRRYQLDNICRQYVTLYRKLLQKKHQLN